MTAPHPGLSVLIPCYNEAGALAGVLERLEVALAPLQGPREIIVIDDGSTDGSTAALERGRCRVLRHPVNRGYGAALKTGAEAAQYDTLVIADADGTYPLERIPDLLAALEGAEMVVAARTGPGAQIPLVRRPAKWALRRLAAYLAGTPIPDLNSGLRAIRRELWERYRGYYPDGFSLTTTITLAALTNGHAVRYVPIDYHARIGRSKIRPIHDTLAFTQLIVRTVLYFNPLKIFVPLSLVMMALGGLVGIGTLALQHALGIGQFMDVTTVVLIVTGVQLLAIGALADLITKRLG